MNTEQKAKAYDETISKLQSLINNANKQGYIIIRVEELENTFQELKDERMREMAIKAVYTPQAQSCIKSWGLNPNDVITWLEKQGEKDKLIKELTEYKAKYIQETLEKYVNSMSNKDDERIRRAIYNTIRHLETEHCWDFLDDVDILDVYEWLEKQGEEPRKVSIWKHWKDGIAGNAEGKQIYLTKIGNTYNISSCLSFECDYIELSDLDNLI